MTIARDESNVSRTTTIGRALQDFSKDAEFSARRGVMADLYPYVVTASKRMSARAIARFLEEEHGVKVSAVTIAKAIRNPKKYWMFFFDTIEPYLRKIEDAHNASQGSLLFQEPLFECFCRTDEEPKNINASGPEELDERLAEYAEAVAVIEEKWFSLNEELRLEAKTYLEAQIEEFEKNVKEEEK